MLGRKPQLAPNEDLMDGINAGRKTIPFARLTPSAEAVERARAILAENAKGVGTVDGQMIDEAVARKARRTLAAAGIEG